MNTSKMQSLINEIIVQLTVGWLCMAHRKVRLGVSLIPSSLLLRLNPWREELVLMLSTKNTCSGDCVTWQQGWQDVGGLSGIRRLLAVSPVYSRDYWDE